MLNNWHGRATLGPILEILADRRPAAFGAEMQIVDVREVDRIRRRPVRNQVMLLLYDGSYATKLLEAFPSRTRVESNSPLLSIAGATIAATLARMVSSEQAIACEMQKSLMKCGDAGQHRDRRHRLDAHAFGRQCIRPLVGVFVESRFKWNCAIKFTGNRLVHCNHVRGLNELAPSG
jgi:hypothetical protein